MIKAAIYAFLLMTNLALAQICPNKPDRDLSSELGPLRNQDSIGWCYAFASADLLSHYYYLRQKNGLPSPFTEDMTQKQNMISPIGIALNYNEETAPDYYTEIKKYDLLHLKQYNNKKTEEAKLQGKKWLALDVVRVGGHIDSALAIALQKGFCLEKDAPSESFKYVQGKLCAEKNICTSDLRTVLRLVYDQTTRMTPNCEVIALAQDFFPKLSSHELENLLRKTSRDKIFSELNKISCQNPRSLEGTPLPEIENQRGSFGAENEEVLKLIDKALDEEKIAGIEYFASFLTTGIIDATNPHASSIVGRRMNPLTCEIEYQIRNSWGEGCADYGAFEKQYWDCLTTTQELNAQRKEIAQLKKQHNEYEKKWIEIQSWPEVLQKSYFAERKQNDFKAIENEIKEAQIHIQAYNQKTHLEKIQFFCQNKDKSINASYDDCLSLKILSDPIFFTRLQKSYQQVIERKEKQREELNQKIASAHFLASEREKFIEESNNIKDQLNFYMKGSPEFLKERYCAKKFPFKMRNPNISCDLKTGYIYVKKNDLKKVLTSATVLR